MTITYDKDCAYIEVTEDGVVYRRAIKWKDCVVSVPDGSSLKIDEVYVNSSDQLVLVLEDESEIIVTGVTDHDSLTGVTASQHHTKYTDAEAVTAVKTVKLDDFTAPDDNTDLNASTSKHGLLLKLGGGTTNFLRADGTWNTPPGGVTAEQALAFALSS